MKNEDERIKLFNEVWSEPITTVAKRHGLSDTGLRKKCIKLQIPLPPTGYWAKLKAGVQVPQKPQLPPLKVKKETVVIKDAGQAQEIEFNDFDSKSTEELKKMNGLGLFTPCSQKVFIQWCSKIKVSRKVEYFHPLIIEYQNEVEYRKVRDKEHQFRDLFHFKDVSFMPKVEYRDDKLVLPIYVSDKQRNRACRIIDRLIKAVEDLGGKVSVEKSNYSQREAKDNATITLFQNSFSFQVRETMQKRRAVIAGIPPENRVSEFRPMYEKVFIGKLELELIRIPGYWEEDKPEHVFTFADSVDAPLENQLGETFKAMVNAAQEARIAWVIKKREDELRQKELERQRKTEEEKQKNLQVVIAQENRRKQLVDNIEQQMDAWYKAQKLRHFADDIEAYAKVNEDPDTKESLEKYVELVRNKAKMSDPIREITQEIKAIGIRTGQS